MLPVLAQREGIRLEPQTDLSYLSEAGAEFADQVEEADGTREASRIDGTGSDQPSVVDGFQAQPVEYGRCIRLFNVIDDFNREALAIDVDFSLPFGRVIRSLNQITDWRGCPQYYRL